MYSPSPHKYIMAFDKLYYISVNSLPGISPICVSHVLQSKNSFLNSVESGNCLKAIFNLKEFKMCAGQTLSSNNYDECWVLAC